MKTDIHFIGQILLRRSIIYTNMTCRKPRRSFGQGAMGRRPGGNMGGKVRGTRRSSNRAVRRFEKVEMILTLTLTVGQVNSWAGLTLNSDQSGVTHVLGGLQRSRRSHRSGSSRSPSSRRVPSRCSQIWLCPWLIPCNEYEIEEV